jgi:hypothetical protein
MGSFNFNPSSSYFNQGGGFFHGSPVEGLHGAVISLDQNLARSEEMDLPRLCSKFQKKKKKKKNLCLASRMFLYDGSFFGLSFPFFLSSIQPSGLACVKRILAGKHLPLSIAEKE